MNRVMYTVDEVAEKIKAGDKLLVSGDSKLLEQLPKGNWIGGTIPYFMGDDGGMISKEQVLVYEVNKEFDTTIKSYDVSSISQVNNDQYEHGYSIIILPASSDIHLKFALEAPSFENFAMQPLIGWISGVHIDDLATEKAKVCDGEGSHENKAVVMHVALPDNLYPDIGIINIFKQGSGDTFEFIEDSFSVKRALINGEEKDFYAYVKENNIDLKFPLVADYFGSMINISFQAIDDENQAINFYAPVFKGVEYRQAETIDNYIKAFDSEVQSIDAIEGEIGFSCNCILNFLYSNLEGKKTADMKGGMTFGEVAYQLLNQTLVYLTINEMDE